MLGNKLDIDVTRTAAGRVEGRGEREEGSGGEEKRGEQRTGKGRGGSGTKKGKNFHLLGNKLDIYATRRAAGRVQGKGEREEWSRGVESGGEERGRNKKREAHGIHNVH